MKTGYRDFISIMLFNLFCLKYTLEACGENQIKRILNGSLIYGSICMISCKRFHF